MEFIDVSDLVCTGWMRKYIDLTAKKIVTYNFILLHSVYFFDTTFVYSFLYLHKHVSNLLPRAL
jgi:hypothetical protein